MAIAFDASSIGPFASGTSLSWSHTCTGTNETLLVGVFFATTADAPATITYGSATSNGSFSIAAVGHTEIVYYFFNPPTGTNTITIIPTVSILMGGCAVSYTGTNGSIDSHNTTTAVSGTITMTTTVVAPNCWTVGFAAIVGTGITAANFTTGTQRNDTFTNTHGINVGDSNGTVATGSATLVANYTLGLPTVGYGVIFSIPPFGTTSLHTLPLLGVGK